MGRLKNILPQCLEVEKQYESLGFPPNDPGRLINKGWIECSEFFFRNFTLTEKTITEEQKGA
tara:strand:+ start:200 stop:385 length:186 start_codon:yes stop_codon:yes gene_type:complete